MFLVAEVCVAQRWFDNLSSWWYNLAKVEVELLSEGNFHVNCLFVQNNWWWCCPDSAG